jgi:hypothetical protein
MVGRDEELGRLLAALEVAGRGTAASALLVAGEAGVGKTRPVDEFTERARRDGTFVLAGACLDVGETAAPFAPVAEASPVPAPPSWVWRRGALILAGAAQLITISALTSADPLAVTWAALLLAIAPAPVAAIAAFAPAPVNRLAAAAGVLILIAGIAGSIVHTGLFFVPALVVLAVGGVKLQREQARPGREG